MRKLFVFNLLPALAAMTMIGCTLYAPQKLPTIKNTTSAEQYERIFWREVHDRAWRRVTPLLGANLMYAVPGKLLARDQVVPYLQSQNIRDFAICHMVVKPNGPDMALSYTLQISRTNGSLQSLSVIAVWQQVKRGWILIAHMEQPQAGACAAPPA